MYTQRVTVQSASGLANRQVTAFIQRANEFHSSIWVECGNKKVNAKSILGLLSIGIGTGTELSLSAEGADEEEAVRVLAELLKKDII